MHRAGPPPRPRAGGAQHAGDDFADHRQRVTFLRTAFAGGAERQHHVLLRQRRLFHDRVALVVGNPPRQDGLPQPPRQAQLVARHHAGGGVVHERRIAPRRRRERHGVEPQQRLRAVGGHHGHAAGGGGLPEHGVLQRHVGVVGAGAEVAAVHDRHRADAILGGAPDRLLHCRRRDYHAVTAVAVDHAGGLVVARHAPARRRVDGAAVEPAQVGAEHVAHAVGIDAAQVGVQQHVCGLARVSLRHACLLQELLGGPAHLRGRNADRDLLGNLEFFQHLGLRGGRVSYSCAGGGGCARRARAGGGPPAY